MIALPTEEIVVVVTVLIASLASPLAISCCFYIALLCKNNKPFQGKVSPEVDKTHVDTFQMQAQTRPKARPPKLTLKVLNEATASTKSCSNNESKNSGSK